MNAREKELVDEILYKVGVIRMLIRSRMPCSAACPVKTLASELLAEVTRLEEAARKI